MSTTLRRLAVGAAALAVAATVAAPASAAAALQVTTALPDATVAAGATAALAPILYANEGVQLGGGTMTFVLSGSLDGVSLTGPDYDPKVCTSSGPQKLVCSWAQPIELDSYGTQGYFEAKIGATAAALGESGKLTTTLTIAGLAPVVTTVDVNVAEAVDLTAGATTKVGTTVGGSFDAAFSVHNSSEATAHGVAVIFDTPYAFQSTTKFSNCFYDGDELNACVFDQDLAAGRNYGLRVSLRTRQDTAAPNVENIASDWLTGDDFDDLIKFLHGRGVGPGVAGTGGKLGLTELSAVQSRVKQTDPDALDNYELAEVSVGGKQGYDLAAVGATFTGTAGQVVPVTLGAQNKGPASIDDADGPAVSAYVTLPPGTAAVTAPTDCLNGPQPSAAAGVTKFYCFSDNLLLAGSGVSWTFKIKVNKATSNATGSIVLVTNCRCEADALEINKADNTAKVVLNPTSGGQGGGTSGSLPITGPRAATAGGAGVLLVAAGVIGFVITRRRRTRFEA